MSEGQERARAAAATRDTSGLVAETGGWRRDGEFEPGIDHALLRLQRLAGNRAVLQLLGREGPGEGVLASGAYKFGRHPQFPTAMGQTYYARKDIEIWPSFNLNVERSWIPPFNYEAKPQTTDAAGSAWPVLATPASEQGYKMPDERPEHPGKEYWIRVSAAAAEKIVAAEAQHVADLDAGWNLTGFAAKKAINQAAGEDPATGDSVPAAKSAAVKKVMGLMGGLGEKIKGSLESGGRLENGLGPMMDKAFTQSKTKRDDSGKHRIPVTYVTTNPDDTKVLYEADPNAALDTTATSEVVNLGTIS